MIGLDILFFDNGWRYAKLISHDGKTALVKHPTLKFPFHVSMSDVKAYRPEEQDKLKNYKEKL